MKIQHLFHFAMLAMAAAAPLAGVGSDTDTTALNVTDTHLDEPTIDFDEPAIDWITDGVDQRDIDDDDQPTTAVLNARARTTSGRNKKTPTSATASTSHKKQSILALSKKYRGIHPFKMTPDANRQSTTVSAASMKGFPAKLTFHRGSFNAAKILSKHKSKLLVDPPTFVRAQEKIKHVSDDARVQWDDPLDGEKELESLLNTQLIGPSKMFTKAFLGLNGFWSSNGVHEDGVITDMKYQKNGKTTAILELKTPASLPNDLLTDIMDDLKGLKVKNIAGVPSLVHASDRNVPRPRRLKIVRIFEQVSTIYQVYLCADDVQALVQMFKNKTKIGLISNGESMVVLQNTTRGIDVSHVGQIVDTSTAFEVFLAIALEA